MMAYVRCFEQQRRIHQNRVDKVNRQPATRKFVEAKLITLCADQIDVAAAEAFREVSSLSRAVLDSAQYAKELLPASEDRKLTDGATDIDSEGLHEALQRAITRLQFADRLCQRLSNVSTNLVSLAKLMQSEKRPITEAQWNACLETTRANFTMEQERQMFDATFSDGAASVDVGADSASSEETTMFDQRDRHGSA